MVTKSLQLVLQDITRIINNYAYSGRLLSEVRHLRVPEGVNFQYVYPQFSTMKICDFDRQFLIGLHLLRFAQNGTKNLSFNS